MADNGVVQIHFNWFDSTTYYRPVKTMQWYLIMTRNKFWCFRTQSSVTAYWCPRDWETRTIEWEHQGHRGKPQLGKYEYHTLNTVKLLLHYQQWSACENGMSEITVTIFYFAWKIRVTFFYLNSFWKITFYRFKRSTSPTKWLTRK